MKSIAAIVLFLSLSLSVFAQDIYEVKFTSGFTQHRGALVMYDGGVGKMRVRYYQNGTKMVEQTMRVENTDYGLRITGYYPVYPGTSTPYPNYSEDNLWVSVDEYGKYSVVNRDNRGVVAQTSMHKIEGLYNKNSFLKEFDWEIK